MATLKRWRLLRSEHGAELIEMAVVTPLLLLLVFGIVDFGFMFQRYVVLTNAAVEGARVASMPGYTAADARPGSVVRRQRAAAWGRRHPPMWCPCAVPGRRWHLARLQVTVTHVYTLQYVAPDDQAGRRHLGGDRHPHRALDDAQPDRLLVTEMS